jgi:hypothetical protein
MIDSYHSCTPERVDERRRKIPYTIHYCILKLNMKLLANLWMRVSSSFKGIMKITYEWVWHQHFFTRCEYDFFERLSESRVCLCFCAELNWVELSSLDRTSRGTIAVRLVTSLAMGSFIFRTNTYCRLLLFPISLFSSSFRQSSFTVLECFHVTHMQSQVNDYTWCFCCLAIWH